MTNAQRTHVQAWLCCSSFSTVVRMPRYIAFLRGINLGKRRPKMEQLRALFEALKLTSVETFIASGNVVFDARSADGAKLERQIEQHLEAGLGYGVDTFVRTRAELVAVAAAKPFPTVNLQKETNTLHVGFLKQALSAEAAQKLAAIRTGVDAFHVSGREFYWLCRIRSGESKVWTLPEMRALKLPTATMRNFTTVRKMAALFPV